MSETRRRERIGARKTTTRVTHKADAWAAHHRQSAVDSLNRLLGQPVRAGLTMLMLGIALALPALLYIALANVGQLSDQWSGSHQMSAYLKPGAREAAVTPLAESWRQRADVAAVQVVSPDQGLQEFAQATGLGALVTGISPNPLPWTLLVTPAEIVIKDGRLASLRADLAQETLVEEVRLDFGWVQRLQQIMLLGQRVALGLASLLALGMLLAIGNTLRLAIENRRDEILVVKLVGGTDAFVRRPFLYMGLWYGLGGGLVALLLVLVGVMLIDGPVAALAAAYESQFRLQGLGFSGVLVLVSVALLVGWLGAWLAVGRHLRDIQPQ
ncbi:permease-like cell division protein FtsX [Simiduia agarivorans]|uniref:Cell division protein FtsX n=1 Tax=Simiduia agarivorans (strain DSM 21679 / JCM 13881 / BCRC 17597 / SA1) TaxID=1117647 RepID=K4KNE0_SIMAS|nr:permease-like cell division protein FtsX [Simiduia agarivorans]AFU99730.1 cell division protein FtsX [Simiduia agarivorans SA1 = DSM 21679]